jgi:uncharacterized protein (TIGR00369 family)
MRDSVFEPRNPDFEVATRESFARQGLMAHLGIEMLEVLPGFVELQVPFSETLTQQHGHFHGGVMGAIADSAAGYAAFTLTPPDSAVVSVEYKINMTAAGDGERLIARGTVKRAGRTLIVTSADVFVDKAGTQSLCATILQTIMVLPANETRPAG